MIIMLSVSKESTIFARDARVYQTHNCLPIFPIYKVTISKIYFTPKNNRVLRVLLTYYQKMYISLTTTHNYSPTVAVSSIGFMHFSRFEIGPKVMALATAVIAIHFFSKQNRVDMRAVFSYFRRDLLKRFVLPTGLQILPQCTCTPYRKLNY